MTDSLAYQAVKGLVSLIFLFTLIVILLSTFYPEVLSAIVWTGLTFLLMLGLLGFFVVVWFISKNTGWSGGGR